MLFRSKLSERINYDSDRNILFVNLEGWSVRKKSDIDDLRNALVAARIAAGRRVNSVVNHDGCRIADDLYDDYAEMIAYMSENHYVSTARYSTSTFMRMKMQEALNKRGLAPHIFEQPDEAHAIIEGKPARKKSTVPGE